MSDITSKTVPNYGLVFEGCPDPCAIVDGDVIVATNTAFRAHFGDAVQSFSACVDTADHEKVPREFPATARFIARPANGASAGKPMQWTAWPMDGGLACVRMDGPAPMQPEIPPALAPMFHEPLTLAGMLAGKMFERLDATIWAISHEGTLLISEGNGLKHFGIEPGQTVGLNAFQIHPKGSLAAMDMETALSGKSVRRDQVETNAHWRIACEPVQDANRFVTGMVGFGWCMAEVTGNDRQAKALLSAVAELPVTVWAMEADGTCTLSVGKGLRHFGLESGALVGKNLLQVYPPGSETYNHILRALQGEHIAQEIRIGEMTWFSTLLPVKDALGKKVTQVYGVAENVTERSNAQRRIEEQIALIKSQQEAIATLTSPIIEVWQGVLVVPVIGSLDGNRATRLLEHLLAEVVSRQSKAVILDLTGTNVVDPSTAQNLFDIMRSVRLLGAEGLVSGIRPNVARTMVELDVASASWKTFPTLAEALRRLIGKRSRAE
ncbi:MAG: PAS domain-containing protein [Polyangiaceae bacterium]|nr:PAS domain-containing protein [Polyangiaceae bacterium]